MSADNYFIIRRHPDGGFAAIHGFMSEDFEPTAEHSDLSFPTVEAAVDSVIGEYTEYGTIIHPECVSDASPAIAVIRTDQEKLAEISTLLHEAYEHYFSYEGHCKSSEGHIAVNYGNVWDREGNPSHVPIRSVEIYSYVFCQEGRFQTFPSLDAALDTVREWHATEMAYDPDSADAVAYNEQADEFLDVFDTDSKPSDSSE